MSFRRLYFPNAFSHLVVPFVFFSGGGGEDKAWLRGFSLRTGQYLHHSNESQGHTDRSGIPILMQPLWKNMTSLLPRHQSLNVLITLQSGYLSKRFIWVQTPKTHIDPCCSAIKGFSIFGLVKQNW